MKMYCVAFGVAVEYQLSRHDTRHSAFEVG